MINIITGRVNSGKTTELIKIYNRLGKGDGFYNRKLYSHGHYAGQEIVILSSRKSKLWACHGTRPQNFQQCLCYGTYCFSKGGAEYAENTINSILKSGIEPVYIDEIGPLELQEKGFHRLFKCCLEANKEIYVVIRESCVEAVIKKYNITNYKIINVNNMFPQTDV
ncbi:nucleoside-triphosphatase [Clostridium sp. JN-9]|uniref:nucleoside-triphosphatase n=1 Tax=Clostridium sp. JN-9 TaxID=2507159 RepID=UPI000FFE3069|nr:nucleoside-triphosphatase [Clostridium sp. JN-9]QAT40644.1 hypothetical protein EQM05_10410 [Clostridium sp. JN-9]